MKGVRSRVIWLMYESLREVRKSVPGVRVGMLWGIGMLGEYDGATVAELSKVSGHVRPVIVGRLMRLMDYGCVVKVGVRYYLTDKGRAVWDGLNKALEAGLSELVESLAAEVRRRV